MDDLKKQIGARITHLRQSAGYTQASLAEGANLSKDFVSRLERGVTGVSVESLNSIAEFLNIPLKEVFNFDGSPDQPGQVEALTLTIRNADGTKETNEYKISRQK